MNNINAIVENMEEALQELIYLSDKVRVLENEREANSYILRAIQQLGIEEVIKNKIEEIRADEEVPF